MTINPVGDLKNHIFFIAEYEDGSSDVFAVPTGAVKEGSALKPPACREVSGHSDCQDRSVGPVLEPA